MIPVYRFRAWDKEFRAWTIPPVKRTVDAVGRIGGTVLPGTEEYVDPALLDDRGEYQMPRRT